MDKGKKWNVDAWTKCKEVVRTKRMSAVGAGREIRSLYRKFGENLVKIGGLLKEVDELKKANEKINMRICELISVWENSEKQIEKAFKTYEKENGFDRVSTKKNARKVKK